MTSRRQIVNKSKGKTVGQNQYEREHPVRTGAPMGVSYKHVITSQIDITDSVIPRRLLVWAGVGSLISLIDSDTTERSSRFAAPTNDVICITLKDDLHLIFRLWWLDTASRVD